MRRFLCVLAVCANAWLPATAIAGPDGGASMHSFRILSHQDLEMPELRLDDQGAVPVGQFRKSTRSGSISFTAYGRRFDLQVTDNGALLAPEAVSASRREGPYHSEYRLLKGALTGQPDSWARLTLTAERLSGVIWDGSELYAIAPVAAVREVLVTPPSDGADYVIYRLSDTHVEAGSLACGVRGDSAPHASAADVYRKLVTELRHGPGFAALSATRELELSAVGDLEFVGRFGADSEAELMARFNIIDGIYSEQVGIRIRVTEISLEQQGDGTFDSDDPSVLLGQLADLREARPALRNTGLTHLYTGRNLEEDVIGIAYLESVCSTRFGAGLSQSSSREMSDALTGAHEIGHNFGAVHDGESPCEDTGGIFLMAPNKNGSDQFSQCSLDTMQPVIATAGCVASVSDVDVSIRVSPESTERLLTRNVNLTFTVTNNGLGDADGVLVDITIPAGLTIIDTNPASGSCAPAAGGVSCNVGTVGSGGSSTIALVLGSGQVGSFSVDASVQASGDGTLIDNNAAAEVIIRPAIDLSVSFAGGPVSLEQSTSASRTVTIVNSDLGPASEVTLIVSAPDGIDIVAATPDSGTCNVAARELACRTSTLAARDSYSVAVTTTGRQVGSYTVDARADAGESDLDGTNDTASLSYTVTAQANAGGGGGGGGGGGAAGVELVLLALLAGIRRRHCWKRRRGSTTRA